MPGVLTVEALAQVGAVAILSLEENKGKTAYFGGINKCRFKGKIVPGDKVKLETKIVKRKGPMGVGEATAYEEFGQRCGNLHYLKFGFLLSQDLKKGSAGLVELLEQEAENGMEERKSLARKLGEEAGTKLLLPMMLMLILVVVILMVPAVLAF